MTRHVTHMTIDDAEHYTPAKKAEMIASYPEHVREARAMGIPMLGGGRVFPVPEASIVIPPIPIPKHFARIVGVDFGWDHPFAAVCCAWDRDSDVFYITAEYRQREATPPIHVAAIKPWGAWIPVAWPHDGLQTQKDSGEELRRHYATHGLNMLPEKAAFDDGGYGVEVGVIEMLERMQTGRFKVFNTCAAWIGEFRLYHREEGKIVKLQDDLISASRYAYMMRRFATVDNNAGWTKVNTKWVV